MIVKLIGFCALVQLAVSQELPITFKDGKIGVNFGGYHAEAGLGGLLTGNAAHGGLTASAGTPFGQSAHAGLGGNTGANMRGGLFAGATAGEGVGASASLAGDLNNPAGGSLGVGEAEAHAGGIQKGVIKTVASGPAPPAPYPASSSSFDADDNDLTDNRVPQVATVPQTVTQIVSQPAQAVNVQKIKVRPQPVQVQPTYTVVQKQVQVPVVTKTVSYQQPIVQAAPVKQIVQIPIPAYQPVVYHKRIQITAPYPQVYQQQVEVETTQGPTTTTTSTTPRPPYVYTYDKQKVINEIFSIPFHALRAVNEIINAKLAGGYTVQKTVSYI